MTSGGSARLTKEEMVVSVASLHDVTAVLSAARITEDDLWEGKTDLFPIILHYGAELLAAAMASQEHCILEVQFPSTTPEFQGLPHKLYKVDPFWTVHHTVSMVCKRFGIKDARSFSLATIAGFTLQDSEPLATFGLGSLLPRWKLVLQQREGKAITRMDTAKKYQANSLRSSAKAAAAINSSTPSSTESPRTKKKPTAAVASKETKDTKELKRPAAAAPSEERFPVLILLDLKVFKYKSQRVHIRSTSTISDLLGAVIRSHGVPATVSLLVSTVSGTILDKSGSFAEFGLGKRFQRWQLRIYAGETSASSIAPLKSSKYAWTQLDDSNMQTSEARKIILELEKKMERFKRQAVRESGSSAGAASSSVASKTLAKLEAELAKARDAKSQAEKEATEISAQFEASLKQHMNSKANLEATVARLRDERDKFHSRIRELEKELSSTKAHYADKLAAQEKSLNEVKKIGSGGKSRRHMKSAVDGDGAEGAAERKEKTGTSKSASSDASTSSKSASGRPKKERKTEKDSDKLSEKSEKSDGGIDEEVLLQAQQELQLALDELAMVRKELAHQQELASGQMDAIKEDTERARKETSELREKFAALDEEAALSKAEATSLKTRLDNLKSALEQEKLSRRDAIEKMREMEASQAQAEEARIESLTSKLEAEMEGRYTEVLASNRELYAGIEEMKTQLIQAGKERDELRAQLFESIAPGTYDDGERPTHAITSLSIPTPSKDLEKDKVSEISQKTAPPPPPAPAPAPPPISGLSSSSKDASSSGKFSRSRLKAREDSVFVGLTLASKIEQGKNKLRTTAGPQKQKYTSDLESALYKRFLAMSSSSEELEDLSDDESEESPFDDSDDDSYSTDSSSRALFDLQL